MTMVRHLILVGAGHAHLGVLRYFAKHPLPSVKITLITPHAVQIYSGMLPGWISGHYALSDLQIDSRSLLQSDETLLLDQVIHIDTRCSKIQTAKGQSLRYDVLSLDIGSEINLSWEKTLSTKFLPVRPLQDFVQALTPILLRARQQKDFRFMVVGAGAAGIELTFAIDHILPGQVILVGAASGLALSSTSVISKVLQLFAQRGICFFSSPIIAEDDQVILANGQRLTADCLIAASGAVAPSWLSATQLQLNSSGCVLVDSHHRSVSHANVFAVGDVCARQDLYLPHSGVHAVKAGKVLAYNLNACLTQQSLRQYRPRSRVLYLLATGPQSAIASWGSWSIGGKWLWVVKNKIDRAYVSLYQVRRK